MIRLQNLGWNPKAPTLKLAPPSPGQLEYCIDLIRQHPASGPEELKEAFGARLSRDGNTQYICIEFVNRDTLPIGAIYKSWIVILPLDETSRVLYARSRKGADGDSTLPPE